MATEKARLEDSIKSHNLCVFLYRELNDFGMDICSVLEGLVIVEDVKHCGVEMLVQRLSMIVYCWVIRCSS